MNQLSIFLLAIDISQNLLLLAWVSIGVLIVTIGASWLVGAVIRDESKRDPDKWTKGYNLQWNSLKFILPICLLGVFVAVVPSRSTLYMVAASEIGEQALQLEEIKGLGGEIGGLAEDTIALLRDRIRAEIVKEEAE